MVRNRVAAIEQTGTLVQDDASKREGCTPDIHRTPVTCSSSTGTPDPRGGPMVSGHVGDSVTEMKRTELVLAVTGLTDVTGVTAELYESDCRAAGERHPRTLPSDAPQVSLNAEDLEGRKCCPVKSRTGCDQEHCEKIKYTAFVFLVNVALVSRVLP